MYREQKGCFSGGEGFREGLEGVRGVRGDYM